ncbi:hypothetical protein KRX56_07900 [Dermabacteraceae bacterium TAE3-ERU27]|nr:hypothetical protein [Dermabacteraceae bacterium TAE3-ERU27]
MSISLSRARGLGWFLGALFAVLLLAGCGGKIDTNLTINDDGSGIRTMTVSVSPEDMQKVQGGQASIEKLIADLKPAQLEYQGVKKNGNDVVFTFSLPFKSLEEYSTKATEIVKAQGATRSESWMAKAILVKGVEPFSKGTEYKENFSSRDLLYWLPEALRKQGKISESNVLEGRETKLFIGGKEMPAKEQPISSGKVERYGFDKVSIITSGLGNGAHQYQRTIYLALDKAVYLRDPEGYDKFVAEHAPKGSEVKKTDEQNLLWEVKFPVGDDAQVNQYTNELLLEKDASFTVSAPLPDVEEPLAFAITVQDSVSCEVVCDDGVTANSFVVLPEGWETSYRTDTFKGQTIVPVSSEEHPFKQRVAPLKQSVAVEINPQGGGKAAYSVTFSEKDDKLAEKLISSWLKSYPGVVIKREAGKSGVVYTATVSGKDSAGLLSAMRNYGYGDQPVVLSKLNGGIVSDKYLLKVAMGLPIPAYTITAVDGVPITLTGIDGLSLDEPSKEYLDAGLSYKDGVITFSGPQSLIYSGSAEVNRSWVIWLALGGSLLLVLVAALVAFLLIRKKINSLGAGTSAVGAQSPDSEEPLEDRQQPVPSDYPTERLDIAPPTNDNLTQPLPSYPEHWVAGQASQEGSFPWTRTEEGTETSAPESESDATKGE